MNKKTICILACLFYLTTWCCNLEDLFSEQIALARDVDTGPHVSMDFQDADLKDVLKIFSQQAGLNFIASQEVEDRKVTLYLDKVSVGDALNNLLKANKLAYEKETASNIFIVKSAPPPVIETITKVYYLKYATVIKRKRAEAAETGRRLGGVSTAGTTGTTAYQPGETLAPATAGGGKEEERADIVFVLEKLISENGKILTDSRTNSLIITDTPERFPLIEYMIVKLDTKLPQVLIEAKILEVSLESLENLGIEYGSSTGVLGTFSGPNMDASFPLGSKVGGTTKTHTLGSLNLSNFAATLSLLAKNEEAKYLATPNIITLDNEPAEIRISADRALGERVITGEVTGTTQREAERIETGTILKVTPKVNTEDTVTLLLEPEVSRAKVSALGTTFYDPHKRSAKTTVRIKHGETVVIGGLLSVEDTKTEKKVPLLGDIPLLGNLFRSKADTKKDTEIFIFITPYIIRGESAPTVKKYAKEIPEEEKIKILSFREQESIEMREESVGLEEEPVSDREFEE